jgi:hypothetical protein
MSFADRFKKAIKDAGDEVVQKANEKLDDEFLDPTLREHSGEPKGKIKPKTED